MNFQETVDTLKEHLSTGGELRAFLDMRLSWVEKRIVSMEKDILKAMNDEEIEEVDTKLIQDLKTLSSKIIINLTTEKWTDKIIKFISLYNMLLLNWSKATQTKEIEKYVEGINNMLEYKTSMIGLIEMSRGLLKRVKLLEDFEPAALSINRAYLDSLYSDIEGNKDLGKKNKK